MNSSYKGKILISTPDISGDIFSRSVVLILDHNDEGAFGLILNKKNPGLSLQAEQATHFSTDIYEGGPVENDKLFIIGKGKPVTNFFMEISEDFYATEDIQSVISAIMENQKDLSAFKFFSGYSGLAAQQLESVNCGRWWMHIISIIHRPTISRSGKTLCRISVANTFSGRTHPRTFR